MKKLLFIAVLSAATACYAQPQPPKLLSAGDYLIKSGRQRNTAIVIGVIGITVGIASASAIDASDSKTPAFAIMGIGGLIALILDISANNNERKAGEILNKKGIGLAINKNGIGIKYAFK